MIISFLAIAIGLMGAGLLTFLFLRIKATEAHLNLRRHRGNEESLVDLLNYASVIDDGVVLGKNGALMASWIYAGPDSDSSTDEQKNMIAKRVNQAFSSIAGSGWMMHIDAIRQETPTYSPRSASHFPDKVTAAIDEERRQLFERIGNLYDGAFVLTITYYPPLLVQAKFVEYMFDDDSDTLTAKGRVKVILNEFSRACDTMESNLGSVLNLRRLGSSRHTMENGDVLTYDHFLQYLQYCVTGKNHPVILPKDPSYLDNLIGGEDFYAGITPRIGQNFIQCVAIDGFPMESYPGILNTLSQLPVEYRWSSRFIFMDPHEATGKLEKYRKKWRQKVRGFGDQLLGTNKGAVDEDAQSMMQDAQAAIAEVNSGHVAMGYYTSVIVLMGNDRAQVETEAVKIAKAINDIGFTSRLETINTVEAYLGSLPGHGHENVRRPLINTLNLAHFIPSSTIWAGEETAPCPMYPAGSPPLMQCVTQGSAAFRLNLHVRDLGHTMMFGPTRAGKSTHLAMLAAQLRRYEGMSIFAFDKGGSMLPICKATGGRHYDIAGERSTLAFAPLQYLATESDRAWALTWIDTMLQLNNVNSSPSQRNEIARALANMHETGAKTLTEFCGSIQDRDIQAALEQYTLAGSMGFLLDADSDSLDFSDFTCFEIETLMGLGERFALPVLLYLFRRVEERLKGQPAAIILDEAWLMLAHPAFRDKIREWLKAFAKKNCIVIMATQSLSDAEQSGILDVIVESTASKIFLPNVNARDKEARALYGRMGLNDRQIEIIANALPKRQYYFVSEQGRRLYELALGPLALAFVGATDKDSLAEINALERIHGEAWVHEWLATKGLALNDYLGEWNEAA